MKINAAFFCAAIGIIIIYFSFVINIYWNFNCFLLLLGFLFLLKSRLRAALKLCGHEEFTWPLWKFIRYMGSFLHN